MVDVLYDSYSGLGASVLDEPLEFEVSLGPGEVRSFSKEFIPGSESRYVLSCEWDSESIMVDEDVDSQRLVVYEGTVSLVDVFWMVDGVRVSSMSISDTVEAHVVLRANTAGVSDYFTVKIRKDVSFATDVNYITESFSFLILEGESEDFVISFYPDERSGGSFNWYFIEVFFSDGSSWLMDQLSPPRLKIQ